MAEYLIQDTTLDAIADAINAKTGGSSAMTPAEMVMAIGTISGGGGVEHYQYTQVEDWLTDATGNAVAFYNKYLSKLFSNKNSGFGFAIITNNVAEQYAALYMFRNFVLTNRTVWMRRNGASTFNADSGSYNISFYISAGSSIDVYFVQDEST